MKICPLCQTKNFDGNANCKNCNAVLFSSPNTARNVTARRTTNRLLLLAGALITVSLILLLVAITAIRKIKSTPETVANTTQSEMTEKTKQAPTPYVPTYEKDGLELIKAEWAKRGVVMIWGVTVKNVSDKPLGDITFRTTYFSETGNIVKSNNDTIQKIVPPGETRLFEVRDGFAHNETFRANFEMLSWRIVE